jgi:predicted PurR-regulated permease PerM
MQKQNIQNIILFGVFALFFVLVARLFMPFLTVILWSTIFLVFAAPLFQRLSGSARAKALGKKPNGLRRAVTAGVVSIGSVLVIVVPLGILGYLILKQSGELIGDILAYMNGPGSPFSGEAGLRAFLIKVTGGLLDGKAFDGLRDALLRGSGGSFDLARVDAKGFIVSFLKENQARIFGYTTGAVKSVGGFIVSVAFMVFTLYFFLMDGPYLLSIFSRAIPIKGEYMGSLVQRFNDTTKQLVRGNLLVAIIQGGIAFILFTAFRIRGSLLLAFLVSVCSFIPMVGAGLVWFPVGLSHVLVRDPGWGLLLLALSATLISLLDNFYRPLLVGGPIRTHPLPLFFAIVGGISIFGVNGLIIGPLILVLFFSVLDIFRDIFKLTKDAAEGGPAEERRSGAGGAEGAKAGPRDGPAAKPEQPGKPGNGGGAPAAP